MQCKCLMSKRKDILTWIFQLLFNFGKIIFMPEENLLLNMCGF